MSGKRYRYTGKERDEETGLYYHGVRHYAAWLGRWTAADPLGNVDGLNLFAYVGGNPLTSVDSTGTQGTPAPQSEVIGQTAEGGFIMSNGETAYGPYDEHAASAAPSRSINREKASKTAPTISAPTQQDREASIEFNSQVVACNNDAAICKKLWPEAYDLWIWRLNIQRADALSKRASESGISVSDQAAGEKSVQFSSLVFMAFDFGLFGPSVEKSFVAGVSSSEKSTIVVAGATEGDAISLLPESSLTGRQAAIHGTLQESGAAASFAKKGVSMPDLRAIGRVTGDEYSMFTLGARRFVIRGYGNVVRVPSAMAADLKSGLYGRWSGHTHAPGYEMGASTFDRQWLPVGQARSAIWGEGEEGYNIFHGTPADDASFEVARRQELMRRFYEGQ